MSYEKRARSRRRRKISTVIIFIIIIYLLFTGFITLFKRNTKTTLPETIVITDAISTQGFLIKKEYIIKSTNNGVVDLVAYEGERLGSGREVASINTLKDMKSLEYELKEIEENISSLEKKETKNELITKDADKIKETREELILDLQNQIAENNFENIGFIKEQLLLYDEKYKNVDFAKSIVGQSVENLKDRKENISQELNRNHIKYYTNNSGIISYEIDGYEEIYLPKDFENYTYDKLNAVEVSKIILDEKSKVSVNEPICKIMDNFKWYIAMKIEDIKEISDFDINNNIRMCIDEEEEEIKGKIIAINKDKRKAVIIVELNTMFHKYYDLRFPQVQIVKEKINGYKIPKKSIVNVDNIDGVYVKDRGGIVRFKPISIFKEDNIYVYIYSGDEKSNIQLSSGSETVKTITLFDEILTNPNNIKEGDIL